MTNAVVLALRDAGVDMHYNIVSFDFVIAF